MGVSERLSAAAVRRPQVLLVPVPGAAPVRWAAEDALDARGWSAAESPAAADLLLCCGEPGQQLDGHVSVAWDSLPGPRARVTAARPEQVGQALDRAVSALGDLTAQRRDAQERATPRLSAADRADEGDEMSGGMDMDGDMDMSGGMDHSMPMDSGMDMSGGMDMDMPGGMDHSMHMGMDMGMDLPGGLVMADRMTDRDGLRLEGLNLSLGPLLPGWPAGLRLDVGMSGDVLTRVEVLRLDPRDEPSVPTALRALDAIAALLAAAGWSDGALRARRARAQGGTGPATVDLLRRLRRARLLRWSLRQLPAPGGGDLVAHLDRLLACASGSADLPAADDDQLARDLLELDLGTAALVVAAHGPLTREVVRA